MPEGTTRPKFEAGVDEWLWFLAEGQELDPENPGFGELREETREAVGIIMAFTKQERARQTYE